MATTEQLILGLGDAANAARGLLKGGDIEQAIWALRDIGDAKRADALEIAIEYVLAQIQEARVAAGFIPGGEG